MTHPAISFAVAESRIDDLHRERRYAGSRRRLTAAEAYEQDPSRQRVGLIRRLARFAASRRARQAVA